mgnify:CR=1 FL=1
MADGPIERLRARLGDFTPSEEAAARYFIEHPTSVVNKTIAAVAREAGLSSTAIMRMCQRIGYSGYAEFRFCMNRQLLSHGADADRGVDEGRELSSHDNLANAYSAYLRKTTDGLDKAQLARFARLILNARRISIWGANRTYESVKQLSLRLFRIGIFNQTTSDEQVMDDISTILGPGDLCIVMSMNGRGSKSYGTLMSSARDDEPQAPLHQVRLRGRGPSLDQQRLRGGSPRGPDRRVHVRGVPAQRDRAPARRGRGPGIGTIGP